MSRSLEGEEAHLRGMVAEGRMSPSQCKRALRRARIRWRKHARITAAHARDRGRFKRAARNARRFEARTGLETTSAAQDPFTGKFLYWNFSRNEVRVWGGKWWRK